MCMCLDNKIRPVVVAPSAGSQDNQKVPYILLYIYYLNVCFPMFLKNFG